MKISLIIPLYDARQTGWRPLASALHQTVGHWEVDVVAVLGRATVDDLPLDADALALLRHCAAVVHVDADPRRADMEIPLLLAGYGKASGDLLYFMEGHTILEPDACATIAAYFDDRPHTQIAWAPRNHHSDTTLGALIGVHSKHHEYLAAERGGFWLGANSVITRELFEQLGGLDPAYMRFAERVLSERMHRAGIAIGRLPKPLATHHDDMPTAQLIAIGAAAGKAKFRYYNVQVAVAGEEPARVRHPIYLGANHAAIALMLLPLSWLLAQCLVRAAVGMARIPVSAAGIQKAAAYRLFVLGFGFADLSGYCAARLRAARMRRKPSGSAANAAPALAQPRSMKIARPRSMKIARTQPLKIARTRS